MKRVINKKSLYTLTILIKTPVPNEFLASGPQYSVSKTTLNPAKSTQSGINANIKIDNDDSTNRMHYRIMF